METQLTTEQLAEAQERAKSLDGSGIAEISSTLLTTLAEGFCEASIDVVDGLVSVLGEILSG